jgi:LysM repeat protein
MRRVLIVLICLSAASLACSLSSASDEPQKPVVLLQASPSSVPNLSGSPLPPVPSATCTGVNSPPKLMSGVGVNVTAALTATCTARADWPVYAVRPGDTLASIAGRTGSTVNVLATANCLTNPSLITSGQTLYVPVVPVALPTPVPTTPAQTPSGPVIIRYFTSSQDTISRDELAQHTARIPVSWAVDNRTDAMTMVFEQVMPDGTTVNVELPRSNPWVPASGNGMVAPVLPPGDLAAVEIRMRVIWSADHSILAESSLIFSVRERWTSAADPLGGNPAPVSSENPRWKILVLIYASTDFTYTDDSGQHRVTASMTQEEIDRATSAATRFFETDVPALDSGYMRPILTIRYPAQALTALELTCGYWPAQVSIASELDPAFDSVIVIWDDSGTDQNTGQSADLNDCGGLAQPTGAGQTYAALPIDSVVLTDRNVFKHEWGHSILFYYDAAGTAPKPAVDNHINDTDAQYVHCMTGEPYILQDENDNAPIPNSIYNNDRGFTHDYYSGTTARPDQPTQCLGITPAAWASGGPVTKR